MRLDRIANALSAIHRLSAGRFVASGLGLTALGYVLFVSIGSVINLTLTSIIVESAMHTLRFMLMNWYVFETRTKEVARERRTYVLIRKYILRNSALSILTVAVVAICSQRFGPVLTGFFALGISSTAGYLVNRAIFRSRAR